MSEHQMGRSLSHNVYNISDPHRNRGLNEETIQVIQKVIFTFATSIWRFSFMTRGADKVFVPRGLPY